MEAEAKEAEAKEEARAAAAAEAKAAAAADGSYIAAETFEGERDGIEHGAFALGVVAADDDGGPVRRDLHGGQAFYVLDLE
jgi:hypothetical protein